MRKNRIFFILIAVFLLSAVVQVCGAASTYNYRNFETLISQLKSDWLIPNTKGEFHTFDDQTYSYAEINWYQWWTFDEARNFVLSMDLSWRSASQTPNNFNSGCGLVFREVDNFNFLFASLRMDGNLYVKGERNGKDLSYGTFYYGRPSLEATHNFTVIANEDNVRVLMDGRVLANIREVSNNRTGSLGFAVSSGTNKDWGTWCQFANVNYYTW